MIELVKKLFPLNRSLSGKGNVKTLEILKEINKEISIKFFISGKKVFDWEIPLEWNVEEAYIRHESGKKFACFSKNNLHLASYSIPINKRLKKKELLKKIYTKPELPNAIPYVTMYYKDDWGFCISENEKKKLVEGDYDVVINSSKKKGKVHYGECFLKGRSNKEIIFSTNICHPSMANNELSGPVVLNYLISYIKQLKVRKFSYRFLFLPETIGSIAYIHKNFKKIKKNTHAGFVVSCVGDDGPFSWISSPEGNNIADLALRGSLIGKKNIKKYSFLERGSDERQFCSPIVNLPFCGFSRSKYGTFKEYHTSQDNLHFISEKGLNDSLKFLKNIVDVFEHGFLPKVNVMCEPNLSKRGLYPDLGKSENRKNKKTLMRLNLLAYSNGKKSLFEISEILGISLDDLLKETKVLIKNKLLNIEKS